MFRPLAMLVRSLAALCLCVGGCSAGDSVDDVACEVVSDESGGLPGVWYPASRFVVRCDAGVSEVGLRFAAASGSTTLEPMASLCAHESAALTVDAASAVDAVPTVDAVQSDAEAPARLRCGVPVGAPAEPASVHLCSRASAEAAWRCARTPAARFEAPPPAVALIDVGIDPTSGAAPATLAMGQCLTLELGPGLLAASEGTIHISMATPAGARFDVPLLRGGCGGGGLAGSPALLANGAWLGLPGTGAREVLAQVVQVGADGAVTSGPPTWLTLPAPAAPPFSLTEPALDARRGAWLAARIPAAGDARQVGASVARLRLDGAFSDATGELVQVSGWTIPMAARVDGWQAVLDSATWLGGPWPSLPLGARFEGTASVLLDAPGAGVWRSADRAFGFVVAPTRQDVVIVAESPFAAGLVGYGLSAAADALRVRVRELSAAAFAGLRVRVLLEEPDDQAEFVRVALLDRDPNGLGLLGVDSSPGKDVGNTRLDESLVGFGAAAALDNAPAHGGVFLSSFFRFSPTVGGISSIADPAFDTIFAPFAPELGGEPWSATEHADEARQQAFDHALEVLANLVSSTLVHEVGHTLGLCAVDGRFHHMGDNPGWIMDAGLHRSFAERAGLPGAPAATWGPIDGAYLDALLGSPAP